MSDEPLVTLEGVAEESGALEVTVLAFVIEDDEGYRRAAETLLGIKDLRAKIAATFDPHIKRAYDAHRALCREKHDAEESAVTAEAHLKVLMGTYDDARERAIEAARRAHDKAAVEQHCADTLAEAIAAEARGDGAAAAQILDRAPLMPAFVAPPPTVRGIARRERWKARVVNFAALVKFAVEHPAYLAMLKPDQTALDAQAKSLQQRLNIPGVEAYRERDIAAGRR